MRFFEVDKDGFVLGIGKGETFGKTISEERYNLILDLIHRKPDAEEHYDYKLSADKLEWHLEEADEY